MSLLAIKQHMMQVKLTTLGNLCALFGVEPETMRCLLSHWMQKGNIRRCAKKAACGTKCQQCPVTSTELYEWIDNKPNQSVTALTCF